MLTKDLLTCASGVREEGCFVEEEMLSELPQMPWTNPISNRYPEGSKDPIKRFLGPKHYDTSGIWALKPFYLSPWTLRVWQLVMVIVEVIRIVVVAIIVLQQHSSSPYQ